MAATDSGKLDLSDDAFRQVARAHPSVAPLRELRSSLSELRLSDLAVGEDGRNRCLLSAFRSRTGRNQPSNSSFIFGPSVWLRGLIKPPPGYGLAYIDWANKNSALPRRYLATRPCWTPTSLAIPISPSPSRPVPFRRTPPNSRSRKARTVQGVRVGRAVWHGPEALAARIGQPTIMGRELIRLHQETYKVFWRWSDAAVDHATLSWKHRHSIRLEGAYLSQFEPAVFPKLPHAGQRRRNAPAGVLSRH